MSETKEKKPAFSIYAAERKERINTILQNLAKHSMDYKKLIGLFSFQWGLREQRVEEYLKQLQAAELIQIKELANPPYDDMGRGRITVKITKHGRRYLEEKGA